MPGAEPQLGEAIGGNTKRADAGWPKLGDAGGCEGDQPGLAIDRAGTLRNLMPRHDLENEAAPRETHDVESWHCTRKAERNITRGLSTDDVRRADFTKWSKCLRSELCDGNA